MELKNECLPCMAKALVKLAERVTEDKTVQKDIITYGMKRMSDMPYESTTPYITAQIYDYAKRVSGQADPYLDEKKAFNQIAESLIGELGLETVISESKDPLETAIRLSIAGNIIDYSLGEDVDENGVRASIERSLTADLFGMDMDAFKMDIDRAKRIMVIADNAGEIVFDKLLVKQLPIEKTIYAVKGGAIVNDATMQDAIDSGMTKLVDVVENGASVQGTLLEHCSTEYVKVFNECDLIISKGQANFETLDIVKDKDIYFMLRAKCKVIANEAGCGQGEFVFMSNK